MMLENAEAQVKEEQYAAGIMLAQAAVEMTAYEAFASLIAKEIMPSPEPLLDLVTDFSLTQKRTQSFWEWLTGRKITEPNEVWQPYRKHVERRNRVAHGREWGDAGAESVGQDARESVAAARKFMERMAEDLAPRAPDRS
jgi:hypothetical protein